MSTSSAFTPTVLTVASAATSGSGEINTILNPSAAGDTTGWTATGSATVIRLASGGPLDPVIPTGFTLAAGAAADYVKYDFVLPASLRNTKLKIEWSQAAPTTGEWKVELRTQAGVAYALTTDSAGVTSIPAASGKFTTSFTTDSVQTLSLRFVRVTGSGTLVVSNVIVGPGVQPQGAVVGPALTYIPTFTGLGTPSAVTFSSAREGSYLLIDGKFTSGTSTGTEIRITLGYGGVSTLTVDSSIISNASNSAVGTGGFSVASEHNLQVLATGGQAYLKLGTQNTGNAGLNAMVGNTFISSGQSVSFFARVPIAEWAGSGTVNLAQNDTEYAYNTDTSNTDNTTSFGYGPNGVTIGSFSGTTRNKRVRFQTPIQVGDSIQLELKESATSPWVPASSTIGVSTGLTTGMALSLVGNATDVDVQFGSAGYASTVRTAAGAWSGIAGQWAWRVRKSSSGQAVGFGIVQPSVSSGLVSASGLPGRTDGIAVAAGYVGEKISASLATINQPSPVSLTWYDDSGTLTLPAGNWIICSTANVSGVNPGGISGAVIPLTGFGLRTGSTVLKETIVSSGQVNGVTFIGSATIVHNVSISSTTVYKQSIIWAPNSGSPTLGSIATGSSFVSTNPTLYAVRIA